MISRPDELSAASARSREDEIMEGAARAAGGFAELGVRAGDAIAVVLRNDFPFFEASFAAQRIGAYACR